MPRLWPRELANERDVPLQALTRADGDVLMAIDRDNPFYFNYSFGPWDAERICLSWFDRIKVLAHPTYVQIDGYGNAHHFKIAYGKVWLLKSECVCKDFPTAVE